MVTCSVCLYIKIHSLSILASSVLILDKFLALPDPRRGLKSYSYWQNTLRIPSCYSRLFQCLCCTRMFESRVGILDSFHTCFGLQKSRELIPHTTIYLVRCVAETYWDKIFSECYFTFLYNFVCYKDIIYCLEIIWWHKIIICITSIDDSWMINN